MPGFYDQQRTLTSNSYTGLKASFAYISLVEEWTNTQYWIDYRNIQIQSALLFLKQTRSIQIYAELCVVHRYTYLPEACQLPPGCSALRHRKTPGRHHPPEGTQQAAAPDPQPGDLPEPGHEPERQIRHFYNLLCNIPLIILKHQMTRGGLFFFWVGVYFNSHRVFYTCKLVVLPWSGQQSPLQSPQGCGCSGHARRAASLCWKKQEGPSIFSHRRNSLL